MDEGMMLGLQPFYNSRGDDESIIEDVVLVGWLIEFSFWGVLGLPSWLPIFLPDL